MLGQDEYMWAFHCVQQADKNVDIDFVVCRESSGANLGMVAFCTTRHYRAASGLAKASPFPTFLGLRTYASL